VRGRADGPLRLTASFWLLPDTALALHGRDLARLLRLVAVHGNSSQTRIGTATGLSQGQVSQIMNGSRVVRNIDVLERIADGLEMPDGARVKLGLAPCFESSLPAIARVGAYSASQAEISGGLERLTAMDGAGVAMLKQLPFDNAGFVTVSRNWLIGQLSTEAAGGSVQESGRDGAAAVRDTFAAFQEIDTKYGGAHAHDAIVRYLHMQLIPLIGQTGNAATRNRLYYAAAELVYLAGMTAFDSGSCGLAQRYFSYSLRLAEEAGESAFAGNVLAAMAHLANNHKQGKEAANLARAGLVAAGAGSSALRMRLQITLGRACALQGNGRECARAIDRAERALDALPAVPEHRWTRFLDSAYLLGEMAQCFLDLKDFQKAQGFAEQSIAVNEGRHRRLALSHVALVVARGEMRDREGAVQSLGDARRVMGNLQSSRTLSAVRQAISSVKGLKVDSGWLAGASTALGPTPSCCIHLSD